MAIQTSLFHNERALNDAAQRLEHYRDDRVAVQLHLSRLQRHRRQPHHVRIAVETFEHHVRPLGGQIFPLASGDIFYVTDSRDLLAIEAAVERQRALFSDDPVLEFANPADEEVADGAAGTASAASAASADSFCTWYHLDRDYDVFLTACREVHRIAEQSRSLLLQEQALKEAGQLLKAVDPAVLGRLEEAITRADLSNMIRSQMACTVLPGAIEASSLQPVFREYFVSVADLRDTVVPGVDLDANRWLFQYLTIVLDRRMMAHIAREPEIRSGAQAFSLNMNIATILSPEFQKFDAAIPSMTRGRLVVEFQLIDIFADLGAYIFARDYLQERGYRSAIDGLTHLTLRYVDRARLGADLVKLYWTPDGLNTLDRTMAQSFRSQVMETGQARTILCRCEDEAALDLGREMGIIMFQGRYVERLYNFQRNRMQPVIAGRVRDRERLLAELPPLTATRL